MQCLGGSVGDPSLEASDVFGSGHWKSHTLGSSCSQLPEAALVDTSEFTQVISFGNSIKVTGSALIRFD